MKSFKLLTITVSSLLLVPPAWAQMDHSAMVAAGDTIDLPEICNVVTSGMAEMSGMGMGGDAAGMADGGDQASMSAGHMAMMEGMGPMHDRMMTAMAAEDIDVAFICGMIPHHQGAIAMARAELEHGDDSWAQDLARQIIEAQEAEIADMLDWLDQQAR